MHIVSVGDLGATWASLLPFLLLAIGVAAALGLRVFRLNSIVGPTRVEADEPLDALLVAAGTGFAVWWCGGLIALRLAPGSTVLSLGLVLMNLLAPLGTAVVIVVILRLLFRGPGRLGISPRRIPSGIAKGLLAMLIVVPLIMVMSVATEYLWRRLHMDGQYVHQALMDMGATHNALIRGLLMVTVLAVSPVSEELFFRMCMQTLLASGLAYRWRSKSAAWPRWAAVIITSLLFAYFHPWWSRPPIFVLSLCLGYAYERTGNLWTSITMHSLFNAAEVALFFHFLGG